MARTRIKVRNWNAVNAHMRSSAGPMKRHNKETGREFRKDWRQAAVDSQDDTVHPAEILSEKDENEMAQDIRRFKDSNEKIIIGFIGLARAGKDTCADYFVRECRFKKIPFAESLKEACRNIFSFNDEQLHGNLKEAVDEFWGFTPRFALQKVGTECMRNNFDKEIWVKSASRKIANCKDNVVVSDVRFMNEVKAIQDLGGYIVKVVRDDSGASGGIIHHASEMELIEFQGHDFYVENNCSFEVLYNLLENVYMSILTQKMLQEV